LEWKDYVWPLRCEAGMWQSAVFVGIYAESYGWVAPGMEVSGLEDEYRLSIDKPRLTYAKQAERREPRLEAFLDAIRAEGSVSYRQFKYADELASLVADDLADRPGGGAAGDHRAAAAG
jgi:hypothetical protein